MAAAAATVLLSTAAARAQCPSCSNPNLTTPTTGRPAAEGGHERLRLSLDGVLLRSDGLVDGSGATDLSRKLEASSDTVYQHRLLRLGASVRLGPERAWAVEAQVPFEWRESINRAFPSEGLSGLPRRRQSVGLGDAVLLARRRWLGHANAVGAGDGAGHSTGAGNPTAAGGTTRFVDAGLGTTLPLGATSAADGASRFETVLQLGSGTFMPVVHAEAGLARGPWVLQGNVLGRFGLYANGDDFRRGSSGALAVVATRRWPRLDTAASVEVAHARPDHRADVVVENTGNTQLYAALSASAALAGGVSTTAAVRVPVWRHSEGVQLREAVALLLGLSWAR